MAEESMLNITADVERILDNNPDAAGTHSAILCLAAAADQLVMDLADMRLRLTQLEARAEARQASNHNPRPGNDAAELDLDQLERDVEVLRSDPSMYVLTGDRYPAVKRLIMAAPGLMAMVRSWKELVANGRVTADPPASHDINTMLVKDVAVNIGELRIVGKNSWCNVFEVDGRDRPRLISFTLSWRVNQRFVLRTEELIAGKMKEAGAEKPQEGEGQ